MAMSTHRVAEAKNQLSRLIDRALQGEPVVITRHGHPVVEIKAVKPPKRPMTAADLAWIEANRVKPKGDVDPVALLMKMRYEEDP
jgi:prevent-host-death family protein